MHFHSFIYFIWVFLFTYLPLFIVHFFIIFVLFDFTAVSSSCVGCKFPYFQAKIELKLRVFPRKNRRGLEELAPLWLTVVNWAWQSRT